MWLRQTRTALAVLGVLVVAGCQAGETDVAVAADPARQGSVAGGATTAADAATGAATAAGAASVAPAGAAGQSGVEFRFPPSIAGHLQLVGRRLRFIACGTEGEARSIDDNANDEATAFLRELDTANNGINVVLRLAEGRVVQLRYGAAGGVGCDHLPPEGDLDAKGNEPFWSLRIDGDRAVFRTPELPDGVTYDRGRWNQPDAQHWRYTAPAADGGRGDVGTGADTLSVALTASRCTDSMSGARYPFAVTVTRAGTTVSGCALEGRRSFRR